MDKGKPFLYITIFVVFTSLTVESYNYNMKMHIKAPKY